MAGFLILTYQYHIVQNELETLKENHALLWKMYQRQQTAFPYENEILAITQQVKSGVVVVSSGDVPEGVPIGEVGGGTGFIIHADGYILTNRHVAEAQTSLKIITTDNKMYDAQLMAMSSEYPNIDLALMKASIETPKVLEFGNTQELSEGEAVFSVGHPASFGRWVALAGEFVKSSRVYTPSWKPYGEVYVDKPAGVGESGAPFFNLEGKVVGIVYGGSPIEERRIGPEDQIVVWFGNSGNYWSNYTLAHDTDTIYQFIKETLGEALATEIFESSRQ
jgi:S1-C subfamily serine protease